MSLYKHGINVIESPVRIGPARAGEAILPVVFGTAPVNQVEKSVVNDPIIAWDFDDAKKQLGYCENFEQYTLCEVMKSYLGDYKQAPIVFINVLDPSIHKESVIESEKTVVNKKVLLEAGIIQSSISVKNNTTSLSLNTDYLLSFDKSGNLIITATADGAMASLSSVKVAYEKLNPAMVGEDDIIGGIDASTGIKRGLELINDVFPKFKMIPTVLMAPKFSKDKNVAAVMNLKADAVNGNFKAIVLEDLDASSRLLTAPSTEKQTNEIMGSREIVCWPLCKKDGKTIHMSTAMLGTMAATDAKNGYIPYVSPSNKDLLIDGTVLNDGNEIRIAIEDANILNQKGIVTAVNFIGGMRSWGNRSAYYQTIENGEIAEPKDVFIAVRRMIDYVNNSVILKCWHKVDNPMNKRLVSEFLNEINLWFNGLVSAGALLGGRIEILKSDNPSTELMDGKLKFRVYIAPPVPAESVSFVIEYDPNYLSELFA